MLGYDNTPRALQFDVRAAQSRKSWCAADFRVLPRIAAVITHAVTGAAECRIHQSAYPHPRNSALMLAPNRVVPRISAAPR